VLSIDISSENVDETVLDFKLLHQKPTLGRAALIIVLLVLGIGVLPSGVDGRRVADVRAGGGGTRAWSQVTACEGAGGDAGAGAGTGCADTMRSSSIGGCGEWGAPNALCKKVANVACGEGWGSAGRVLSRGMKRRRHGEMGIYK